MYSHVQWRRKIKLIMNIIINISRVHLYEGNFIPLEKKITETDGTVKEEVVMGRRWLSVGGILAPEEPQYWMQNNVETCSTPIEISCELVVGSLIPWSLPTVTLLYSMAERWAGTRKEGTRPLVRVDKRLLLQRRHLVPSLCVGGLTQVLRVAHQLQSREAVCYHGNMREFPMETKSVGTLNASGVHCLDPPRQ